MNEDKALKKIMKELRTGLYTVIIMRLLSTHGPLHGYRLRVLVGEYTNGFLTPSESTIYGTLKMLERLGVVEPFWAESEIGPPRKYYKLTEYGSNLLKRIVREVKLIRDILDKVDHNEV